jgi:hypothetical protein
MTVQPAVFAEIVQTFLKDPSAADQARDFNRFL